MPIDAPLFLLAFLPALLGLFSVCPARAREGLLLVASILFYALSDVVSLPLLALSMVWNMLVGILIERTSDRFRPLLLALGVGANLMLLAWSKYFIFLLSQAPGLEPLKTLAPASLPLGVSFFTFSAIAYLVDIARGDAKAQTNPVRFGLFLAFFAKIAAGPISRWRDMYPEDGLAGRPSLEDVRVGLSRLAVGLAKKVLVAGTLAPMAESAFGEQAGHLDTGTAWLGLVSYALRLYYDFSGYTDMAVGLGRMFGYRLPENFNYPYVSQSVREFWRRWHITLSTWFRDYVYIPLGGGRVAPWRTQRNLVVVFVLCGLWHGAGWHYVVWGLWHGVFLALERTGLGRTLMRLPRPLRHGYGLLAVCLGWVLFGAGDLSRAATYFQALLGLGSGSFEYTWMVRVNREYLVILAVAVLGCTPLVPWLRARLTVLAGLAEPLGHAGAWPGPVEGKGPGGVGRRRWPSACLNRAADLAAQLLPAALLVLSLLQLAAGTHSPFIYAQF